MFDPRALLIPTSAQDNVRLSCFDEYLTAALLERASNALSCPPATIVYMNDQICKLENTILKWSALHEWKSVGITVRLTVKVVFYMW